MSPQIKVNTFLGSIKNNQAEQFTPIEEFRGILSDPKHINGAIELSINGKALITKKQWDLVDQLWIYLLHGLQSVLDGKEYRTYFPDNPIDIVMIHLPSSILKIQVDDISISLDIKILGGVILSGANHCFNQLRRILGDPDIYLSEMHLIEELKERLNKNLY